MAAHFTLEKSSNGRQYYFTLVAANNKVVATSEMYERKPNAVEGMGACRTAAAEANEYIDQTGE